MVFNLSEMESQWEFGAKEWQDLIYIVKESLYFLRDRSCFPLGRSWETSQKVFAIMQGENDGVLDEGAGSRSGKKWLDPGYNLKIEPR